MLDDVGVKTDIVPTLTPTFIIETNPATGSRQFVYVYNELVSLEDGFGMSTAAAEAGLSDGFISNKPSAWHRLPHSLPIPKRLEREAYAKEHGTLPDYRPAWLVEFGGNTYPSIRL